jgi:DNA-binding beta-propeller fold protein YncE
VAIAGEYVYWTDAVSGAVRRVNLNGQNMTTIATGGREPNALAVDGGYVYWTDFVDGTVSKVPVTGGEVTVLAKEQNYPLAIHIYEGYVYWAESLEGNINRLPTEGGPIESVVTQRFGVADFGIYGGYIYWTEGFTQGGDVSQISRAPLQGGGAEFFVKALKPWALTIAGDELYWTEYRWGGVKKVSLTTGQITSVYGHAAQEDDFQIAADDQNIYWTERASGNIMEATLNGGSVFTLASNQTGPYGIASDGAHLVWTEEGAGTVKLYNLPPQAGGILAQLSFNDAIMIGVAIVAVALAGNAAYRLKHKSKPDSKSKPSPDNQTDRTQ